jgi:hypothetical protein
VLSDEDFLPSEFSDWPNKIRWRTQPEKIIRNYIRLCPLRREQQRVIRLPVASRINHLSFAESKTAIKRDRADRRSGTIMTCSLFKISLLDTTRNKRTE